MTRNPKHKRELPFTIEETLTPPDALPETHCIARITKAAGHNTYNAQLPDGQPVLVELEEKFRSSIWIKRGSYVVVDTSTARSGLDGDIVNVVRDEKAWRKKKYWYVTQHDNRGILRLETKCTEC